MITIEEMRKLEEGKDKLELVETAGKNIAAEIKKKFSNDKKVLFVCYHGNNGGDGFVAARYLIEKGYDIDILFVGDISKLTAEAKVNYDILVQKEERSLDTFFVKEFSEADVIVDCLLGLGGKGKLEGVIKEAVEKINKKKAFVISIDVPTGLNADTGEGELFVDADLILTIHDMKPGLEKFKDKVVVISIGL